MPETLVRLTWTLVSAITGLPTLPQTSCFTIVRSAFVSLHFTSHELGVIRPPHVVTPVLRCGVLPLPSNQLIASGTIQICLNRGPVA